MGTKNITGNSESLEEEGELEPLRRNPIKNRINRTIPINNKNSTINRRTVLSKYDHKPAKKGLLASNHSPLCICI